MTGDVLYKVFHSEEDLEETKGDNTTVGFPIANTNVYIVNDEGSLISNKTTIGELWISGSNISLGYTQGITKNFVLSTFNKSAAHRTIFKTGDYGYLYNTGIILVGRKDRLVKIRGQKVNLNEIEASIQETDSTIEAHVLCRFFDAVGYNKLFLFFTSTDAEKSKMQMRSIMSRKLASYMIPKLVYLKEFPLTPTGKIDRKQLYQDAERLQQALPMPLDAINVLPKIEQLRYIVSHVLDTPISLDDLDLSFFELGGDSLRIVTLFRMLIFHKFDLTISDIIKEPSLRNLIKENSNSTKIRSYKERSIIDIVYFAQLTSDQLNVIVGGMTKLFESENPLIRMASHELVLSYFSEYVMKVYNKYPRYCFTAKVKGDIIGACTNIPSSQIEVDNDDIIDIFVNYCKDQVLPNLIKKGYSVLYADIIYTDFDIPRDLSMQAVIQMYDETIKFAKQNSFDVILTVNTSPAMQQIDVDLYGYKIEFEMRVSDFEHPKGVFPFIELLDDDYMVNVGVKYL